MSKHNNDNQLSLDLFTAIAAASTAPAPTVETAETPEFRLTRDTVRDNAPRLYTPDAALVDSLASVWPSGRVARFDTNLNAIRAATRLLAAGQAAGDADRQTLRAFCGWGGTQGLFHTPRAADAEHAVRALAQAAGSDPDLAWGRAQSATLNAHYTHPQLAAVMWQLAYRHGYTGGPVIEPGCGSGIFIALAPAGVRVTGVEMDPSTAQVAALLYPAHTVLTGSFSEVDLTPGTFELAIGNVPFADYVEYDPVFNRGRHSLHNYMIVKSLRLLAPGGLAVLISTHFTLDALSARAREEIASLGELAGVVRLPTGAHLKAAGSDVLTDILIFRRHQHQAAASAYVDSHPAWLDSTPVRFGETEVPVNCYLAQQANARLTLGTPAARTGMYATVGLEVDGDSDPVRLASEIRALFAIPAVRTEAASATPKPVASGERTVAAARDLTAPAPTPSPEAATTVTPAAPSAPSVQPLDAPEADQRWDGHLTISDGKLYERVGHSLTALAVPASTLKELEPLLAMRDLARALLDAEASSSADSNQDRLNATRTQLRGAWQTYVRRYGPLNRYTLRATGHTREDGQQSKARIVPRAIRTLLRDPSGALVLSLETFDDESQEATAAALLTRRLLSRREPVTRAQTPADALAICLEQRGQVDLELIASLLSTGQADARAALSGLVFEDPDSDRLIPAAEYLSGNVRLKLAAARAKLPRNPELQANIEALTPIIPKPLGVDEISAQPGAVWISAEIHTLFLRELLDDQAAQVQHGLDNIWEVSARDWTTAATSTWGTRRAPASRLFKCLLTQSQPTVYDTIDTPDGGQRKVLNADETAAAVEKSQQIAERFSEWVWEDQNRAQQLLDRYNLLFNSLVLRDYEADGARLSLPGMSGALTPTPHQRAAIARIIQEPAVGLFHPVGAGKTLVMAAGAVELKRLGLISKPCLVVPNHMLEQMTRELLALYPHARVLAASSDDLTKDRRRLLIGKIAANDWDAVIITGSAFSRIPVGVEFERRYLQAEIDRIKAALERNKDGYDRTHNQVQKMLRTRENRLRELADRTTDPAVSFEATGIDYLLVDEAHLYKNLQTESNIPDAKISGSKRATDLHMKLAYLRDRNGGRVATFATATPIANSITEAFVMQRYLRPDLLANATIHHFDQWAATFGERVTALEMAPTGGGSYRIKTRFAHFRNVPDMLRMWQMFADVKTVEDLDLPRPTVGYTTNDGRHLTGPRTVVIATPPEMRDYLMSLSKRAERIASGGVDPTEDNMLKVTGDGRRAALDMRLIDGQPIRSRCKLEHAADEIAAIHHANKHRSYLLPGSDIPSPVQGALQIVFCDLSTPKNDGWDAYHELRSLLVARGVPAERVRFIHEARNDREKARLFEACRTGSVSVIVGSTEKMGVGTNIQPRAVALHHLDCPWRPADLEQRDGRAVRQGNQNQEVQIVRYVVEQTFDAYNWQTVERKARFIGQVTRGRLNVREIDDIAEATMSFAEVKALASGDPLILEHAQAMAELAKLQRSRRAFDRNQQQLRYQQESLKARTIATRKEIERVKQLVATVAQTNPEEPVFEILGERTTDRYQAARRILSWLEGARTSDTYQPLGTICGIPVHGRPGRHIVSGSLQAHVVVDQLWSTEQTATLPQLHSDPLALIRPLTATISDLDGRQTMLAARAEELARELDHAIQASGQTFDREAEITAAQAEVHRIERLMAEKKERDDRTQPPADTGEIDSAPQALAA